MFCIFGADDYNIWNDCIHQEPALELQSRAAPNVEAHHRVNGSDTERNSGGRRIIKKEIEISIAVKKWQVIPTSAKTVKTDLQDCQTYFENLKKRYAMLEPVSKAVFVNHNEIVI